MEEYIGAPGGEIEKSMEIIRDENLFERDLIFKDHNEDTLMITKYLEDNTYYVSVVSDIAAGLMVFNEKQFNTLVRELNKFANE